MKPPTDWTTPADIKQQLHSCWSRGQILAAGLSGEPLFPLILRLRKPDAKALSERFDDVRKWIKALEDESKTGRGFGYEIEWTETNHRQLGRNRVPARVVVPAEYDALRLIGRNREAERFQGMVHAALQRFPTLANWLTRRPLTALEHAGDWVRILAVLTWFHQHPRAALYLRQLDIPGVDTKFIETRKGLLSELLDIILPPDAVDTHSTGYRNFEQRYGLVFKPPLVRFRLLDKRLYIQGLSDLTIPAADFARLVVPASQVFITENEINGLTFPELPNSLVVFGLGYSLDRLVDVAWLQPMALHYWGDIDTHGFAILNRLRATFPHAQSLLMDRETLMAHRNLWVREDDRHDGPLDRLTIPERTLFDELRLDHLGERVRLEQERISFGWLKQALDRVASVEGLAIGVADKSRSHA